ncbi:transcription factor fungal specific like protein [Zymoseptoria brevis]|uniref:Transcription factor fungal specific like protein n=1 Tax=Zymoseptoria brevis TaxID=1047168 RepID=A0A0F4GAT8_9PEZI|nr:transcription factor fungal specific like protein [Zymoseptoria brevis]
MEIPKTEAEDSPASNHETGSLIPEAGSSRFIGSSSGVYFINTVKQAFASSRQYEGSLLPAAEETVGGEDDDASARNSPERGTHYEVIIGAHNNTVEIINRSTQLGSLPTYDTAQLLAVEYFQTWHPILPFLSGQDFLQDLDALYSDSKVMKGGNRIAVDRTRTCYLVILQCVFSMGAFTTSNPSSTQTSVLSKSDLLSLVGSLASRHDLLSVQTVLAAQLYCISTMNLRTASSLGGLLSKLVYHAGLHRCPYRYPQLSNEDRDLRKRIFWSAYALDRYLAQSLGIPVSFLDSEIDVCVSGRSEKHDTESLNTNGVPARATGANSGASNQSSPSTANAHGSDATRSHADEPRDGPGNNREVILANFVEYGRLLGRALEIYHASLHSRNHDSRKILFLRSDIDKWFNSFPEEPTGHGDPGVDMQVTRFLPFLHVLYEQLIISINRPSLSLPRSAPEFHHGLQVTIRAAKRTILALEKQPNLFWPGYLSACWMSGLIVSFACQIGLYNTRQGSQEILRCLDLLRRMSERWKSAKRCYAALSTLLSDLQRPKRRADSEAMTEDELNGQNPKRRRRDSIDLDSPNTVQAGVSTTPRAPPATQNPGFAPFPPSINYGDWDVNDFFQDISWENLFEIGDMPQNAGLQFFAG